MLVFDPAAAPAGIVAPNRGRRWQWRDGSLQALYVCEYLIHSGQVVRIEWPIEYGKVLLRLARGSGHDVIRHCFAVLLLLGGLGSYFLELDEERFAADAVGDAEQGHRRLLLYVALLDEAQEQ